MEEISASADADTQPGAVESAAYRVATWGSAADGAVARIEVRAAKKGKREWLPVAIHAETEALAADKAHAFFAAEQERIALRDAGVSRRLEAARAARAAKSAGAQ